MPSRATAVDFSRSLDLSRLDGKGVLITGGTDGIGLDIARAAATHGAYVTITGRSISRGQESAAALTSRGHKVQFIQSDVVSWDSQLQAFKAAVAYSPKSSLDVVIANAGLGSGSILTHAFPAPLDQTEDLPAPSTATLDVNITGAYYTTVLALHFFKKTATTASAMDKKQLIFMASMKGYIALPLDADYTMSKFALRSMFKTLRFQEDALGFSFRTNLVAPGYVETAMTAAKVEALVKMGLPAGRVDQVTDAVLRILVDETIDGRAVAVTKDATWDLEDDPAGADAANTIYQEKYLAAVGGPGGKALVQYDRYFR